MVTGIPSYLYLHKDCVKFYFLKIISVYEKLRSFKDTGADLLIYRSDDLLAPLGCIPFEFLGTRRGGIEE